jgi:hypothetical protein
MYNSNTIEKFILKTKNGEILSTTKAENAYEAIDYFAKVKKLSVSDLLSIFDVEVVS